MSNRTNVLAGEVADLLESNEYAAIVRALAEDAASKAVPDDGFPLDADTVAFWQEQARILNACAAALRA